LKPIPTLPKLQIPKAKADSKSAVIQREDARTPWNPIKCHPNTPFLKDNLWRPKPSHGLLMFIEVG